MICKWPCLVGYLKLINLSEGTESVISGWPCEERKSDNWKVKEGVSKPISDHEHSVLKLT